VEKEQVKEERKEHLECKKKDMKIDGEWKQKMNYVSKERVNMKWMKNNKQNLRPKWKWLIMKGAVQGGKNWRKPWGN
jgi:hypothetical protein